MTLFWLVVGCGDPVPEPERQTSEAQQASSLNTIETIYIVPGSHLDIGFTDTPAAVRDKRIRVLDDALDTAALDPQFHWFEEGGWVFDAWRTAHRDDPSRLDLARRFLKNGQLGVGASWANPHAGMFPESLDLLLLHREWLESDFGYVPSVAVLNDSPSYPEALVDAFAKAGVRYLLIGANMLFTKPLPERLSKKPFYWESATGHRLLVWVDDDSYLAACTPWGIDPDCARYLAPEFFPRELGSLETMQLGVARMFDEVRPVTDAAIVQDAFDNWDLTSARKLPGFLRLWAQADQPPKIQLSPPEEFFTHVEEAYEGALPVYRGEWSGEWDAVRAACPVWTWRLREALRHADRASPDVRKALATAMEHSQILGPGWPGMLSKEQTLAHIAEVRSLLERAVGPGLATATPPPLDMPETAPAGRWTDILAGFEPHLLAGPLSLDHFVSDAARRIDGTSAAGAHGRRLVFHTTLDRRDLPGSTSPAASAVVDIALRGDIRQMRIAPEGSRSAIRGLWLRGEPPSYVVAPAGVRVLGPKAVLRVSSPLVFSWTLVPDADQSGIVWLRGLVVRQSTLSEFRGSSEVLPFEQLYPGEPAVLDVDIELRILRELADFGS